MKCPNNQCKRPIDASESIDANFDYCKECGTIIYRNKNRE